jgi:hypothetical protein
MNKVYILANNDWLLFSSNSNCLLLTMTLFKF